MYLKVHEWGVLEELNNFLQLFSGMTELVSTRITSLSLVPLVRAEILDACQLQLRDCDELKSLKNLIMKNIDKRLPMTDEIILSTLMDPSTKSLVSLSDEEKLEVVYKAVKATSQLSKNPTHI